jgi:ferric-dicitrate binding protein FerR (iron transport regulator)
MLLAVVILVHPFPARSGEQTVGRVAQLQGEARVIREGATTSLAVGSGILRRDRVLTGSDGRVAIEFADGSFLAVGSDSEVLVADYTVGRDGRRLNALLSLLSGIVRAVVADHGGSFDITSRAAVASARSTTWLMEVTRDATAVFAAEGVVAVQSVATNSVVRLEPGMGTDVAAGEAPAPPKLWGQARVDGFVARTRLPGT